MVSRREFLKSSSLIALAPSVPAFLAGTAMVAAPNADDRILVILQLSGGNDGINTVVPFADEGYSLHREKLRLETDRLHKLNDEVALHPAMQAAKSLYDEGQFAIVQGVGYPNPNRSHDVSMAIWQSARRDREEHGTYGWIGRALDRVSRKPGNAPAALLAGEEKTPLALRGRKAVVSSLSSLNDLQVPEGNLAPMPAGSDNADDLSAFLTRQTVDAFATAKSLQELAGQSSTEGKYPATKLAYRLRLIATLIKAGLGTRVYYAMQSGYDTHSAQVFPHAQLLRELAESLNAFLEDMKAARLSDRILVMGFSEFGRRVQENGSAGTDHGTAGPVFLAGGGIRPGLHGETPSLTHLEDGDLKHTLDFRRVYAAILTDWMKIPSSDIIPKKFQPLPLIKSKGDPIR